MFMCDVTKTPPYESNFVFKTVNYCSFVNGDVSIKFNGKDNCIVLEFDISLAGSIGSIAVLAHFFKM